jgi:hypothetical protein
MVTDSEDQNLQDVIKEEKSRGTRRRAVDTAERKKRLRTGAGRARAIKSGDLHAYVQMLHGAGMKVRSPECANALKIFHSFRGQH